MKKDKQENNDVGKSVVCYTNPFPYIDFSKICIDVSTYVIIGSGIDGDTYDYEKLNKIIYL